MLRHRRNLTLDICDYENNKLCTLYDSNSDVSGQAHDVIKTTQRNGWKEISFSIPSVCEDGEGRQVHNYRLDFLKADYRIRFEDDDGVDWYLISEPKIKHVNFSKDVQVSANHIAQLLKTKNLGLEFSDKEGNNVGTAAELLATILEGTGWEPGTVAEFKEKRSGEIKIRSMKASSKTGAFKLIANMCDLFEAKPIYYVDSEGKRKVDIVPMNPFSEPEDGSLPNVTDDKAIELHYGKNVSNVTRTLNTENLVTKLYCYGSFGDKTSGYCGIDEWQHPEYKMTVTANAGQECCFTITDANNITYKRYFRPTVALNGTELIWSLLDPASMRYVWDETNQTNQKAYLVYEDRQDFTQTNDASVTSKPDIVVNQFQFLMNFDYYNAVGLLTDTMLQKIAKYQREMPAVLKDVNDAATAFAQKLNELAEVVGSVNFCKLNVSEYGSDGDYLKLTLSNKANQNDEEDSYQNGVIYRTDYTAKVKDQFKWRTTNQLKPNGDPMNDAAAIVYIIHTTYDPVRFSIGYLKKVVDENNNEVTDGSMKNKIKQLTLWIDAGDFNYTEPEDEGDEIYLFGQNSINGLLGALQVMDESTVQSLESQTKVITTNHPVYFVDNISKAPPVSINSFIEYAWVWVYNDQSIGYDENNEFLYFADLIQGDTTWQKVSFIETEDDLSSQYEQGLYAYAWRESTLYKYDGEEWNALNESPQQQRLGATFGTVWAKCIQRNKNYKGYPELYTYTVPNGGLHVGNYAFEDEYKTYHAFTFKETVAANKKIYYDTTNRWVLVADSNEEYPEHQDISDIIGRTIEVRDFRFDNVFENKSDILSDTIWEQGSIETGNGQHKEGSDIFFNGGGELDDPQSKANYWRSGFCGAYPNVTYSITAQSENATTTAFFYQMNHGFLGSTQAVTGEHHSFTTPTHTRFVRIIVTGMNMSQSSSTMTCGAVNANSSFIVDEEVYNILGNQQSWVKSGKIKGILPLMKMFCDLQDEAYIEYYQDMITKQAEQKRRDNELINDLGDIYREGYWQKADYVDGDEDKLYDDGLENLKKIAVPDSKYDISYLDLYDSNSDGFEYGADDNAQKVYWPDISSDFGVHIVDPEIAVSQWAFIDKIDKCYDMPWKTKISINTNLSTIGQHSFTDVMTHIADVAKQIKGKMEIYDRADIIDQNGNLATYNLEGKIDADKLAIVGGSSTWYTDANGNLMFESADGKQAMMVSGNGFLIAAAKDEFGEWIWRTAGTGEGLVADVITTGTLEADRVVSNKLMSYLNRSLVLTSNQSIVQIVGDVTDSIDAVQDHVDETQYNLDKFKSDSATQVTQLEDKIQARVTQTVYDANNVEIDRKIATVTEEAEQVAIDVYNQRIGTHFSVTPDYVSIKQDQSAAYEQQLTAEEMRIVRTGTTDAIARFGVNGAVIDRITSKEKLNIGTDEYGYYEIAVLQNGVADKWRKGSLQPNFILVKQEPVNQYCTTSATLTVSAESTQVDVQDTLKYQWYRRWAGDTNADPVEIQDEESDQLTLALSSETNLFANEYCCKIYNNHNAYWTRFARVFNQNAPMIAVHPKHLSTISVQLSAFAYGGTQYKWQKLNNGSWENDVNGTGPTYTPTSAGIYRCEIDGPNGSAFTDVSYVTQ